MFDRNEASEFANDRTVDTIAAGMSQFYDSNRTGLETETAGVTMLNAAAPLAMLSDNDGFKNTVISLLTDMSKSSEERLELARAFDRQTSQLTEALRNLKTDTQALKAQGDETASDRKSSQQAAALKDREEEREQNSKQPARDEEPSSAMEQTSGYRNLMSTLGLDNVSAEVAKFSRIFDSKIAGIQKSAESANAIIAEYNDSNSIGRVLQTAMGITPMPEEPLQVTDVRQDIPDELWQPADLDSLNMPQSSPGADRDLSQELPSAELASRDDAGSDASDAIAKASDQTSSGLQDIYEILSIIGDDVSAILNDYEDVNTTVSQIQQDTEDISEQHEESEASQATDSSIDLPSEVPDADETRRSPAKTVTEKVVEQENEKQNSAAEIVKNGMSTVVEDANDSAKREIANQVAGEAVGKAAGKTIERVTGENVVKAATSGTEKAVTAAVGGAGAASGALGALSTVAGVAGPVAAVLGTIAAINKTNRELTQLGNMQGGGWSAGLDMKFNDVKADIGSMLGTSPINGDELDQLRQRTSDMGFTYEGESKWTGNINGNFGSMVELQKQAKDKGLDPELAAQLFKTQVQNGDFTNDSNQAHMMNIKNALDDLTKSAKNSGTSLNVLAKRAVNASKNLNKVGVDNSSEIGTLFAEQMSKFAKDNGFSQDEDFSKFDSSGLMQLQAMKSMQAEGRSGLAALINPDVAKSWLTERGEMDDAISNSISWLGGISGIGGDLSDKYSDAGALRNQLVDQNIGEIENGKKFAKANDNPSMTLNLEVSAKEDWLSTKVTQKQQRERSENSQTKYYTYNAADFTSGST